MRIVGFELLQDKKRSELLEYDVEIDIVFFFTAFNDRIKFERGQIMKRGQTKAVSGYWVLRERSVPFVEEFNPYSINFG